MAKLAKKGKKVKLLDESASVKELPKQEDAEEDDALERDDQDIPIEEFEVESPAKTPSSVKKKMSQIKQSRDQDDNPNSSELESAQKLFEAQQQ